MTRAEFNDYVRQTNRKLYVISFRMLRNREEAEDAVQEVFIKLWNMGTKLDNYDSIDALATTMTKNHCIDMIRKQKNIQTEEYSNREYFMSASPSPYEQITYNESKNIINSLIEKLPDIYKNIIILREIEGLSYEEIAEKTNQNINTLRVSLSRARSLLRDEYKKHSDEKRRT
jgi:RNA polymerase sigma factor (sigma-70 family)